MSFLGFLRKNKKSFIRKPKVALEVQLSTLESLGIRPSFEGFVDWLCAEWGREKLKLSPIF